MCSLIQRRGWASSIFADKYAPSRFEPLHSGVTLQMPVLQSRDENRVEEVCVCVGGAKYSWYNNAMSPFTVYLILKGKDTNLNNSLTICQVPGNIWGDMRIKVPSYNCFGKGFNFFTYFFPRIFLSLWVFRVFCCSKPLSFIVLTTIYESKWGGWCDPTRGFQMYFSHVE